MADEQSSSSWWKVVGAAGYLAGGIAAGYGGAAIQRPTPAEIQVVSPTFSWSERLELERKISVIDAQVTRFESILTGRSREMSQQARERIESLESRLLQLEMRARPTGSGR